MRTTILALVAVLVLANVAGAHDWRSPRSKHGAASSLSNRGIVGGRAVGSDRYRPYSYRPYGYGTYGYRAPWERVIIIERDVVPRKHGRRW